MFTGPIVDLGEHRESNELLLADPVSEIDNADLEVPARILYLASFDELARNHMQYETVIWISISLLLILAWGIGLVMLLCIPVRRYILRKDITSRKLYVTQHEIVYKVVRPSFIPFCGFTKTERHIPLPLVIDVIIEQGCLQSLYGIHTFRVENIACGKATLVDELRVQGVSKPELLRKVIMTEAYRSIQEAGRSWKPAILTGKGETVSSPMKSRASSSKSVTASPRQTIFEDTGVISSDFLLHRLEEVKQSVKELTREALQAAVNAHMAGFQSIPTLLRLEDGLRDTMISIDKFEKVIKDCVMCDWPLFTTDVLWHASLLGWDFRWLYICTSRSSICYDVMQLGPIIIKPFDFLNSSGFVYAWFTFIFSSVIDVVLMHMALFSLPLIFPDLLIGLPTVHYR